MSIKKVINLSSIIYYWQPTYITEEHKQLVILTIDLVNQNQFIYYLDEQDLYQETYIIYSDHYNLIINQRLTKDDGDDCVIKVFRYYQLLYAIFFHFRLPLSRYWKIFFILLFNINLHLLHFYNCSGLL